MKKNVNIIPATILLFCLVLFLFSFKNTPPAYQEIVTVKVIQTFNNKWSSAFITYSDGTIEERELPKFKMMGKSNLDVSNQSVGKILNEVVGKGYTLISNGAGTAQSVLYEVYVFGK